MRLVWKILFEKTDSFILFVLNNVNVNANVKSKRAENRACTSFVIIYWHNLIEERSDMRFFQIEFFKFFLVFHFATIFVDFYLCVCRGCEKNCVCNVVRCLFIMYTTSQHFWAASSVGLHLTLAVFQLSLERKYFFVRAWEKFFLVRECIFRSYVRACNSLFVSFWHVSL